MLFFLTGCATQVPQILAPPVVPATFTQIAAQAQSAWPEPQWWEAFGSAELSDFVAKAQAENRDLEIAAARVLAAQAQVTIQRSALFPTLSGQAQAQRSRMTNEPVAGGSAIGNTFGLSLGASYEVDIWGLARSNLRSASEALKSSRFARQNVALTLTANVANTYFSVLALRKRIAIANENIAAINDILGIIRLKVETGKSSHLELAQEQAQVEAVEAQLPVLQQQELDARVALAVLLGRPPEGFEIMAPDAESIQSPLVNVGLPSDLLLRRPDVAQAEANLASAHANLDAARAAFLPQFGLTGNGGYASVAIGALLSGPSVAWEYGAELLQTVFDGGRLIGRKRLAEATQKELIASYQSAVLNAYADVESALGQVRNNGNAEEHLGREVRAAREAFEISQLQYRQGTTDLLTVLQAQQTLFFAEDQLAQIKLARMQGAVHLYEALGGGWVEPPDERTQTVAQSLPHSRAESGTIAQSTLK